MTSATRSAAQITHKTRSLARACGSGSMRSGPDRMPRGLELEQVAQLVQALRLVGEPVDRLLGLREPRALHAVRGAEFEHLALLGIRHAGDRAQVCVRGHRRDDFLAE